MTELLTAVFAVGLTVHLAIWDLRTGLMPNRVTLSALGAAILGRGALDGGNGLVASLSGVVVAAVVPLGLHVLSRGKAIGGGDVKALAAVGALLGPTRGLSASMWGFIVLAVFVLIRAAASGSARQLFRESLLQLARVTRKPQAARPANPSASHDASSGEVRFGPSLALGTVLSCATWAPWSGL